MVFSKIYFIGTNNPFDLDLPKESYPMPKRWMQQLYCWMYPDVYYLP